MAHAGGRPTKLTPELIALAKEHLSTFDISAYTLLPTIEGLALELKISRETIYQWEKEDEEFSDIVREIREKQAQKLIQLALAGKYNASIAKLILSGKHGYVEKTESAVKIQEVTPILGGVTKQVGNDVRSNDSNE